MDYQGGGGQSRGCFNCNSLEHQARDCPTKGNPKCYNCGGELFRLAAFPVRATSPANVPKRQNPSPATDAAKKVTSPANAQTKSLMVVAGVPGVAAAADTLAVAEDKNATNVVKLDTSLATATKVEEVTRVVAVGVAMAEATAAVMAVVEEAVVVKLATPVVDLDTCHVIVPKARSATTVAKLVISPATARLNPRASASATSASSPATSRRLAPTKPHITMIGINSIPTFLE
ncbi:hypothetical protein EPUS_08461 [Endocarpon pusillum Z07020]|uniref:CCHC-type domain-containing protein n=1 Tax=Endocarpon pusillum (strain Z07020 / HMAS-L-300199) TaxID=1263415 RepID=U1GHL5_ENDPU|nr:uncharacterized protein EPUS_08461 [Endocarpon pusillum Z07020]ERF77157.1 hypothetical protein EPUS_08461 [Endocarpon pusillum Z07020]